MTRLAFFDTNGRAKLRNAFILGVVVGVVMATRTPMGFLNIKSDAVLAIVVPIAGTIVALALPAAQLAQSVMQSILSTANDLLQTSKSRADIADYLGRVVRRKRCDLSAMRSVVLFSFASLIVGLLGVIGTFSHLHTEFLAVKDVYATLSTTFLVISVLWFLPVVRSSFDISQADNLVELLRENKPTQSESDAAADVQDN